MKNTYPPMKMEQTDRSETSAYKIQTPGNYPEECIQRCSRWFVCAAVRSLKFSILQMSGWGVVKAIASTVLRRKILLIHCLIAYLLTVCALFSPNYE